VTPPVPSTPTVVVPAQTTPVPSMPTVVVRAQTTRCPICGRPLVRPGIATHDPQTPPWLCNFDRHGFWNVELSPAARKVFRPGSRDFGFTAQWLRDAVEKERGV